jgi:hypothetical protein
MSGGEEKRRAKWARELRERIAGVGRKEAEPAPRSPHEFVQEQMRELSEKEEKEKEEGEGSRGER